MPRPIWKGYITFGLVNIPVILYSADKKADIQFKLIDDRNHSRIRYVRVNEKTGDEVPWGNVVKGYEYEENNYVIFDDKELKELAGEHSKTINIDCFVNESDIDSMDFDKPYYLVPDKKGEKGYVLLRETLKESKKIGITKVVIHTREYLAALLPYENALLLNLLHYHNEIIKPSALDLPSDHFKDYKISSKEINIAKQLVNSMTMKWKPNSYHDEYKELLEKRINEKIHHKPRRTQKTKHIKSSNVINFIDLLKKSLKNKNTKSQAVASKKRKH